MTHTRMVRISFLGGLALLLFGVLLIFSRKPFAYWLILAGMALSLYFFIAFVEGGLEFPADRFG